MEKSRLEIKVGLFVFIGMVLLAVLVIQFSKGASLFRDTYTLKLHAANVGGLKAKSNVLLAGVPVGTVHQIALDGNGTNVTITLQIYQDFSIYHDAQFLIESAGFLGDQFVAIKPTANTLPVLTNGETVFCQEPFNLEGFEKRLDETTKDVKASIADLRAQVLNAQTLANFGTVVTNMRMVSEQALATVQDLNQLVAANRPQVNTAVSNAVAFTAELNHLAGSAQELLATNRVNITAATADFAATAATIKQLSLDLQAGKGLAGAVLQNQELATNVEAIAANLAVTSSNLNRLGLWGVLWSHKPAGTNPPPVPINNRRR